MPLLKMKKVGTQSTWALWLITETESELGFEVMETCPDEIISTQKRLEWLSGRALLKALVENCGLNYLGIRKDEYGKPFLKEHSFQISLTHSFPYVAAQIHNTESVGIDLEQPKDKLLKIAHRVLSPPNGRMQAMILSSIAFTGARRKHCIKFMESGDCILKIS